MELDELLSVAQEFGASGLVKPADRESFESSHRQSVDYELSVIQARQEMTRTMMAMTRIKPFLTGMTHFEKTLNALGFEDTAKVMAYVWGPVRYLLEVSLSFGILMPMQISVPDISQGYPSHPQGI